ncbi:hypothetical protein SAMN05421813_10854 [Daejeonella rubra]|uniref:DUF5777 domain-containing protein n=1 Tax=Daejeonella rubra TaxID=990371 RepID=A0A1G9RK70_9SPHI|nr:DUF5777 family beta-barrel protein [Daejeonella rubra]SDM23682.1 hypothetical protein SAMN05421813_10854 [Daejeonella rubra]
MKKLYLILFIILPFTSLAQDDLMKMVSDSNEVIVRSATFKATRIINGHSVETVGKNNLDFIISHRFDRVNRGFDEFFGLDAATNRLGLEYGLNDRLMVGIGRSSFQKMYDFFGKYKLLRQSSGAGNIPISLTLFSGYSLRTQNATPSLSGFDRSSYTSQLLIARKFSEGFSLQLSPTLIHRNRPDIFTDSKTVIATGIGGRMKLTKRTSINGEYHYVLPNQIDDNYTNNLSFSFDLETGGHVFQLLFTNSFGMTERQFITETDGSWGSGDIHFGFNISRTFSFEKKKKANQ